LLRAAERERGGGEAASKCSRQVRRTARGNPEGGARAGAARRLQGVRTTPWAAPSRGLAAKFGGAAMPRCGGQGLHVARDPSAADRAGTRRPRGRSVDGDAPAQRILGRPPAGSARPPPAGV